MLRLTIPVGSNIASIARRKPTPYLSIDHCIASGGWRKLRHAAFMRFLGDNGFLRRRGPGSYCELQKACGPGATTGR